MPADLDLGTNWTLVGNLPGHTCLTQTHKAWNFTACQAEVWNDSILYFPIHSSFYQAPRKEVFSHSGSTCTGHRFGAYKHGQAVSLPSFI